MMGVDKAEISRRGVTSKKPLLHPYAAIEHRVIDSPAYADLTYAARAVLLLLARQLTLNNNGTLLAAFSYMKKFGISENTLSRAIRELIGHGLIYRTRVGGYQRGSALFAVTWLPVKKRDGLFLDMFEPFVGCNGVPDGKNSTPPNLRCTSCKFGVLCRPLTPKTAVRCPPKIGDSVLIPCKEGLTGCDVDVDGGCTSQPDPLKETHPFPAAALAGWKVVGWHAAVSPGVIPSPPLDIFAGPRLQAHAARGPAVQEAEAKQCSAAEYRRARGE